MALESAAVAIANKGNRGGAAEDPKKLEALARNVGDQFKVDPTRVLAGLDKFQSLTGDLNLGKIALKDLVGLSKAFKIDVDQLVGSAANVATKIGDVGDKFKTPEEKAKAVLDVMKSLVAQGQEGAIEMPDLVTQLSALGAAAPRFEGSAAANISKMGAMAQLALQMGGAKSASQATTAVMGFANTLSTPARRAQFKAMGVDIDSTSEKGKFLDPFEIIKKSLQATGGDTDKMKKLFANVVGERAVRALTNSYLGAGGGQAGLAAVDKQFARFGGTVNDKQIQDNLGRELGTKASEAQAFQNELDKITSAMGTELAPAMKELAPVALSAAKSLAGIVTFGAQNPGLMITGALVASIGKAAVGEAVGKAVGGMLSGVTASHVGLGLLAAAAIAAAVAIEDYEAKSNKERDKGKGDAALIAKAEKEFRETGKIDKETIDQIATRRAEVEGMRGALKTGGVEDQGFTAIVVSKFTGGSDQISTGEGATRDAKEQGSQKLDVLAGKMDQLLAAYGKTMRVHVENAGDLRGPSPGPTPNPGSTAVP